MLDRVFAVELAIGKIGKFDLGRVGGIRPGVLGEAEPDIKIGGEGGTGLLHPHDLIEIDARVDDLLEPDVFPGLTAKTAPEFRSA